MASSPSAGALSDAHQVPASVRRFFSSYVAADGRVVRRDQGSDTVSEGQGYAMLLAVAARDADLFTTVWNWTRAAAPAAMISCAADPVGPPARHVRSRPAFVSSKIRCMETVRVAEDIGGGALSAADVGSRSTNPGGAGSAGQGVIAAAE